TGGAPDTQGHPVVGIGEREFAVWLLFAREFWGCALHLHMHAGRNSTILCRPSNFYESQQVHRLNLSQHANCRRWARFSWAPNAPPAFQTVAIVGGIRCPFVARSLKAQVSYAESVL